MALHGVYAYACNVGIPHSMIVINLSSEIEVAVFFGTVFEIELYLCHIDH